jgi:hypothetical protein
MKKSITFLVLAALTAMVSSCSVYSCPTYAKNAKEQPKEVKI